MLWQKLMGANAAGGIRLVGSKTFTSINTASFSVSLTDLTGGLASSPSSGDFVLVFFGLATNGVSTIPTMTVSDYTNVAISGFADGTYEATLRSAYKFMPETPDTSVSLSFSGTGITANEDSSAGAIFVFRGVSTTMPINNDDSGSSASSIIINAPSVDGLPGGVFVVAGIGAHREGVQTYSSSDLEGFITAGVEDFNDCSVGAGYKTGLVSFNPAAFTFSSAGTSGANRSINIALNVA